MASLEVKQADCGYGRNVILRNVSLTADAGQILVLAGPNGSGKSTLLKSITGQLPLIDGRITLDGNDLAHVSPAEKARRMAVLLTERVTGGYLTAWEMASYGRYPYTGRLGFLQEADRRKVDEVLDLTGALAYAGKRYDSLSDGQKQRVLIARAVCQEPEVLLMDEPTAYLDLHYKVEMLRMMLSLAHEKEMTIICSLHELDLARRVADSVVLIRSDHSSIQGTPEELLSEQSVEENFGLTAADRRFLAND